MTSEIEEDSEDALADRTSYGSEADAIDPIRMGRAKLLRMGFRPMSPLKALSSSR